MAAPRVATDEQIKTTLHELLKDEVGHAQLGWAHLAAERAAGRGGFLRDLLSLNVGGQRRARIPRRQAAIPWTETIQLQAIRG